MNLMNTMTNSQSETANRICTECGASYEHAPIMVDGYDMIGHFTTCHQCSEIIAGREAREKREAVARERWEKSVAEEYRKTSIDHPDFPKQLLKDCLGWMRGEDVRGEEGKLFLGLIGQSGRCKTRVIAMIAKHIIWMGGHVTWVNSAKFQWCCQNQFSDAHGKEAQKQLQIFRNTSNLVFDDIGSLKSSETVSDNLYSLLESRTANGLRMMWTSNETLEEMLAGKGLTEKARARNISRLGGYSNVIAL